MKIGERLSQIHKSIKGRQETTDHRTPLEKNNMEITRQMVREQMLQKFKHIRTCVLARELCLLIRSNRVALDPKDIHECCGFVAKLCKEAGCTEPSELCRKAAEAVLTNEKEYLDLCMQSCHKCGESRKPSRKPKPISERTTYVA